MGTIIKAKLYHTMVECDSNNLPRVPIVASTSFNVDEITYHSKGNSLVVGATHYREGVVIRLYQERYTNKGDRLISKVINDDYLSHRVLTNI